VEAELTGSASAFYRRVNRLSLRFLSMIQSQGFSVLLNAQGKG